MKNKKGLSIAIILVVIFIFCIVLFVIYRIHVNNKITNGIQEMSNIALDELKEKHPKGDFPEVMKDFLSTSTVDLFDYCFSHPKDFRDKARMCRHYEGVLLYKGIDLSRYKKNLLPKIKKLVGKYTKPDCFKDTNNSTQQNNLPYSPDLKQYQNTLIEWCLIANRFEEEDDGNSAFLLSYAAARFSINLLTDYADGASEENLRTVNNILRCASCQLIYIANSGLKHNKNMVRAIAKDLFTISEEYPKFTRTLNYDLDIFENMLMKLSKQGNYAVSYIAGNNRGAKQLSIEFRKLFNPLYEFCDSPYFECGTKLESWEKDLKEKAKEATDKIDRSNMPKLVAYAFINKFFPNYNNLKINTDETRVIIDGTATVLATYEYVSNIKEGSSFEYSPSSIAHYVGSLIPPNRLSGVPFSIQLPGSYGVLMDKTSDVIFCSDHQYVYSSNRYYSKKEENKFPITFLTKDEIELKYYREGYKSTYFDVDEALSKMTPEQRAKYEESQIKVKKMKLEAAKKAKEALEKNKKDSVEVDSIDDFACGYKFGQIAKNVKDSCFIDSKTFGLSFSVRSKKPFLGNFLGAQIFVDDIKRIERVYYSKSCNTLSERETAFWHIQKAIEAMEGIKTVKYDENFEECHIEYFREKDKCKISLSLMKGLDGGGTISLFASSR